MRNWTEYELSLGKTTLRKKSGCENKTFHTAVQMVGVYIHGHFQKFYYLFLICYFLYFGTQHIYPSNWHILNGNTAKNFG